MEKVVLINLAAARQILDNGGDLEQAVAFLTASRAVMKDILKKPDLSSDDKEKYKSINNDIMYCMGYCCLIKNPMDAENALKAFEKCAAAPYIEVAKGICHYSLGMASKDKIEILKAETNMKKVEEVKLSEVTDTYQQTIYSKALVALAALHYFGERDAAGNYFISEDEKMGLKYLDMLSSTGWDEEFAKNIRFKMTGEEAPVKPAKEPKKQQETPPVKKAEEPVKKPVEPVKEPKYSEENASEADLFEYISKGIDDAVNLVKIDNSFTASKTSSKRKITVVRRSGFAGSLAQLSIYVDGNQVGSVKNGEEFKFEIDNNSHKLQIKMQNTLQKAFNGGWESEVVTIPSGGMEYTYRTQVKMGNGTNLVYLHELSHSWPGQAADKFDPRKSTTATTVAYASRALFDVGGILYKQLKAGAGYIRVEVREDSIVYDWNLDGYHGFSHKWKDFPDSDFEYIESKADREEILKMIHEYVTDLKHIFSSKPGHYSLW